MPFWRRCSASRSVPVSVTPGRSFASRSAGRAELTGVAYGLVFLGPNDDWIDAAGHRRFLGSDWTVQTRSNRTGFRLVGPAWSFAEKATNKRPEHGEDPSNILDHGYPVGAVNLCGQTPIVLVNDGPSTGGFINPYTVPSAAFWKLAQSKPGDIYRFRAVSVDEAQDKRRAIDRLIAEPSIESV